MQAGAQEIDLETYAVVSAHVWHYGPARAAEVLQRLGVAYDVWTAAESKFTASIGAELAREESATAERFALAAAPVKKRLRAENPPIESLGPLREPSAAADHTNIRQAEPPLSSKVTDNAVVPAADPAAPPEPPAPAPARPIEVPSFLLAAERTATPISPSLEVDAPAHTAEPLAAPPAGTLPVFILPRSLSLPFAGSAPPSEAVQRARAQAELVQGPAKPARPAVGETVAPSDLAAIMQKVMPFGSQAKPQGPTDRGLAPPPTADLPRAPLPPSVPVRPPAQAPAATPQASNAPAQPATPPMLSLEQYASLCEDLRIAGDQGAVVLKRYGLSPESKRSVDEHWQRQFQAQPTTYLAWERARSTYRAWLMQRGGK